MHDNNKPDKKPIIIASKIIAETSLFKIEQLDLKFSNGQLRTFERLKSGIRTAVIIAAMIDDENIVLIREYAAGTECYELGLPKGLVEHNDNRGDLFTGANRELQEEVGFRANRFEHLATLTLAPNYMNHHSELILARDLSTSKLIGDEPEPLEVVYYNINQIDELVAKRQITEARSIASLYIVKNYLANNKSNVK
jgi:ADP-ribose diphosphatase